MTDKNLYEQLREKVAAATAVADHAFDEAIAFADEHKLSFYWEGHACGMGGSYEGDPKQREHTYSENGWCPSAGSC